MKKKLEITIEGALIENHPLFDSIVEPSTDVHIDFGKMTYINSPGVAAWIQWLHGVPVTSHMHLHRCPFIIINQSAIVVGFLSSQTFLESFYVPYYCQNCHAEKYVLLEKGKDYAYGTEKKEFSVSFPLEVPCVECMHLMEPDFVFEKTFSFLELK